MIDYMMPFTRMINLGDGTIPEAPLVQTRRLSDLAGCFSDAQAEQALMAENPILYQVYEATRNPPVLGQLRFSTTVIRPGKVGDEYFMTKGHFHAVLETGEVYSCLRGDGRLVTETPEGETSVLTFQPGRVLYVPPRWAHRSVNVGTDDLVFYFACPANAGHDYGTIEKQGFRKLVIERNGARYDLAVLDFPFALSAYCIRRDND